MPIGIYKWRKSAVKPERTEQLQTANLKYPGIIEFSSNLCLECRDLDKVFQPLKQKYSDELNFTVIKINSSDEINGNIMKQYQVITVPTLIFLDKNGKVIKKIEGAEKQSLLEKYMKEISNG
jgi:thioredoxin-like negative regulator of GroEL